MATGEYRAGTAKLFLQPKLPPDFRTQVKKLLAPVNESLKVTVEPKLSTRFRTDLRNLVREGSKGINAKVGIEVDTAGVRTKVRNATKGMPDLKVGVQVDLSRATTQMEAFRVAQSAIPIRLNANVDTSAAVAQLLALRSLASSAGEDVRAISTGGRFRGGQRLTGGIFTRPGRAIRLQVQLDRASVARAEAEVANVAARLSTARRRQSDAVDRLTLAEQRYEEVVRRTADGDSRRTAAAQRLARARRDVADAVGRVNSLIGQERDADVRLGRARSDRDMFGRLAIAGVRGLDSALTDAVGRMLTFRRVTNVAVIALAGLAAVSLVPLLGQLTQAAGVIGLFPAALAGAIGVFATVKLGASGITDAFSAAGKAAESAGRDAISQAKAVESANRSVASAERGVRNAHRETLSAQKDLTRARRDAKKEIDDLNRALGRTALTEEGAALAVAEAQRELFRTFSDPNADALDRAQAQHRVKEALVDQQDVLRENRELAERAAEANAAGVEGSDQVVAAKERVTAAAEAEADAQTALIDAQNNLADAMRESSAAADAFEQAMAKLSPAAQNFVRQMLALKPQVDDFKRSIQEPLFDRLGDAVTNLANNWLPGLKTSMGALATEINRGLRRAIADLDTDASRNKVASIFRNITRSIGPVIAGINDILQGFLSLSSVGSNFLPGLSDGFAGLAKRFRDWAESPEGQKKFSDFIEESLRTFRQIARIAKELGGVISQIFRGSDEVGESWLDSIEKTLKRWNDFLGTPEGQQKIKDFFSDVKDLVEGILSAIKTAGDLVNKFGLIKKPTGERPADAPKPESSLGGGTRFRDRNGNPVDKNGNPLDHQKGIFPGVREGSIGDRFLDGFDFFGGGAFDGIAQRPGQSPFSALFEQVGTGLDIAWQSRIKPSLETAATVTKNVMRGVAQSALDNLTNGAGLSWQGLGNVATNVADSLTAGAFTKIKDAMSDLAENAVDKLTNGAGLTWSGFGNAVKNTVDYMVGGSVIGLLRDKFSALPDFFDGIVSGVGGAFSGLVSAIQGPINAVIGVLNGFGDIWNRVADKLGLPKWDPLSPLGAAAPVAGLTANSPSAGPEGPARTRRWMGGPIWGPGGPQDDKVPAMLSAGEHVWTAAEVQAVGGHDAMYRMRRQVLRGGGRQALDGNYAIGGNVQFGSDADRWMADVIQAAFGDATVTSAFRPGHSGFHGKGQAIDIVGPMQQMADWIFSAYPESSQLIYGPGPLLYNVGNTSVDPANQGALQGIYSDDLAGHFDHVHWANIAPLANMSETDRRSLLDRVKAGIGGVVGRGRDFAVDNLLARPLRALADQVPTFDNLGQFGQIPRAFARRMVDELVRNIASSLGASTGSGGPVNYDPTGGAEQWRDLAMEAMRRTGFNADDPNQVNAMLAQINSESGGNPSILQNVIDVNSGGNEAQGLLQVIPGTFATYRDPSLPNDRTNPLANMVAALNYYRARYGTDLTTTWGHGHGYDQGGIWPHRTLGWNMSGLPEAVLTNPQWKMFQDFINKMPGFNNQLQALPQPLDGGTSPDGTPGLFGVPVNPGVQTFEQVGANAVNRFSSAFKTGVDDLVASTLTPLGLPDPRSFAIVQAATEYGGQLDAWQRARAASAEASAALANSGYQAAAVPGLGVANQMTESGVNPSTGDVYNYNFNIAAADTTDGLRKSKQFADLHALQHLA
ncbi:transglycosylase SLT domain-containing protein [Nocardia brasiliensis]|uniref:transglycosylase SLT domain-containing protein n=1 Tax=Nocardia brasiliensis TaxID=37326 RepID=UPI00245388A9|nr:transglycosylase SLT domain-containing protein [Nocardia brasiliensis]